MRPGAPRCVRPPATAVQAPPPPSSSAAAIAGTAAEPSSAGATSSVAVTSRTAATLTATTLTTSSTTTDTLNATSYGALGGPEKPMTPSSSSSWTPAMLVRLNRSCGRGEAAGQRGAGTR